MLPPLHRPREVSAPHIPESLTCNPQMEKSDLSDSESLLLKNMGDEPNFQSARRGTDFTGFSKGLFCSFVTLVHRTQRAHSSWVGQQFSNHILSENFQPSVCTHPAHFPKLLSKQQEEDILPEAAHTSSFIESRRSL